MSGPAERSVARKSGAIATRTIRVAIPDSVLDKTGEVVSAAVVAQRFRWLDDITRPQIRRRVNEIWAARAVIDILSSTKSHAYVAMGEVYRGIS